MRLNYRHACDLSLIAKGNRGRVGADAKSKYDWKKTL